MDGQGGGSRWWADISPGLWGGPRGRMEGGPRGVSAQGSFLPVSMFSCFLERVSDPCTHWNVWVLFSYQGIVSAVSEFWLKPHLWGAGAQGLGGCVRVPPMRVPVLGSA